MNEQNVWEQIDWERMFKELADKFSTGEKQP
jgi:hypothetical protein